MKTLLVLRHSKSGHDEPVSDKERTLTSRGRKDAHRMGEVVRKRDLVPDRVLCSTATRARETLELFAEGAKFEGPIEFLDELYLAEPKAIVEAIRAHAKSAGRVMVVGHNPGLEGFVASLTADHADLPTSAFVECTVPIDTWADLDLDTPGRLRAIFKPKDER